MIDLRPNYARQMFAKANNELKNYKVFLERRGFSPYEVLLEVHKRGVTLAVALERNLKLMGADTSVTVKFTPKGFT